ncbi:fungal-specific transcription factor domain-containing protein [Hypoxylon cercidicola]|nr:fungal-specific transcription factor domain-containing protein [Hypoxylon cercidicola]
MLDKPSSLCSDGAGSPESSVAVSPRRTEPSDANRDAAEAEGGVVARLTSDLVSDEERYGIAWDPVPSLYTEAQMIFDGLHYFNECVSRDLISVSSHFNPFQIDIRQIDKVPRVYTNLLVSAATLHKAMQGDISFVRSSAMVRGDQDLFKFRIRALQDINYRISNPDLQTSDVTFMCVLCLLLSTMAQSAYTDWRAHLEGARRIIQLRGGLKKMISQNPFLKPLVVFFMIIDVVAATTTPSTHKYMAAATSMALHYWEVETSIFQSILAISAPYPEDLFQSLILVNYLRSISGKPKLASRRQAGTRMVLAKILSFNPAEWAARMKGFRGWKQTGDGVEFDTSQETRSSDPPTQPLSRTNDQSSLCSPTDSPMTTFRSSEISGSNLWLSVGVIYRAAILLYTIRTLVLDLPEGKEFLYEDDPTLDVEKLRMQTYQILARALVPLFHDMECARRIGKLVFFPVFVCGMETNPDDHEQQEFVTRGLHMLGQAMGTFGPISAVDELQRKWTADTAAPEGHRVTWDDHFRGRPDFIFGF